MSKSPNTNAQVLDVQVEETETEIAHNLGRVAKDGFVIRQTVPDGETATKIFRGTTAWDGTNIYLQAEAGTFVRVRFYVF